MYGGAKKSDCDDDEPFVRASAVLKLKSQGRIKLAPRETRSLLDAYKLLALYPGHIIRKKMWEKRPWGGITRRQRSEGVRVVFFC